MLGNPVPVSAEAVLLDELMAGLLVGTATEQKTLEVLDARVTARHSTDAVFSPGASVVVE